MSTTLLNYLTDFQRLVHDSNNRFWSQAEQIDYVNKARKIIAAETGCTRQLISLDIVAATNLAGSTYSMDSDLIVTPTPRRVVDVLDILLTYSANASYQLKYLPFERAVRTGLWQTRNPGTPSHYTINNRQLIILQWPAIDYLSSTVDCAVEPSDLVATTDIDTDLFFPYTEGVGFYMAYLAKLKDQKREEAEAFMKDYQRMMYRAIGTEYTRRLVNQ
jgi:hypothetical protein